MLDEQGKTLEDLTGIVAYQGPGSFTGLRIGLSVANALAYGLSIPIVGATGDDWLKTSRQALQTRPETKPITPEYGAPVHITQQKK